MAKAKSDLCMEYIARADMWATWRDGEYGYCRELVMTRGNENVRTNCHSIAGYLRLQASTAFKDGQYEIAARLGEAATAISWDARNDHMPDWHRAVSAF